MTNNAHKVVEATQAQPASAPTLVPDMPARARPGHAVCVVIDDEPGIQNIIASAAASMGFQVERFRSADKAIKAMAKIDPGLLFLDVSLEGSDAIDVIRGLDAAKFRGVVQLMSGKDAQTLEEVRRVGERHSLVMLPPLNKPFRLETVRTILREHLENPLQKADRSDVAVAAEPSYTEVDIDTMLRKNWLELWYQPKIGLKEMRFTGAEGLIRCRHPEKGVVEPALFLPGADESGLIRLTEMVLRTALTDWIRFAQIGFPFRLAINIPVNVLSKLPILALVRDLKPKHDSWPGIILEITEDQVMRDIPLVHEIATQLRIHDILLAIDDFGTGYSHLARLKELPFAELKLAQTLVTNCGKDQSTLSVCQAAIDLAHRFGATAVAEGIENISELKALREMNCDVGQGFLFGKPLPRDRLIQSLVEHAKG